MPVGVVTCSGNENANTVMQQLQSRGCKIIAPVSITTSPKGTVFYGITYDCPSQEAINEYIANARSTHLIHRGGKTKRSRGTHGRTKKNYMK